MRKDACRGCATRLVIGTILDMALALMLPRLEMWSSYERECWLAFVYAALGAVVMVCVVPVLGRGTDLQRVQAVPSSSIGLGPRFASNSTDPVAQTSESNAARI